MDASIGDEPDMLEYDEFLDYHWARMLKGIVGSDALQCIIPDATLSSEPEKPDEIVPGHSVPGMLWADWMVGT